MIYVILLLMSILLGQCCKHLCKKLPPVVSEEITYAEFSKGLFKDFEIDLKYSLIFIIFTLIEVCLFNFSIYKSIFYLILFFILSIVFSIDYRFQLIPDECQIALIFLGVIKILARPNTLISSCLGALVGFSIFYAMGLLAMLIFKKEGMGFGDVKLMTGLGLIFGLKNIIVITLISFVVGAIISVILMIFKNKDMQSYIPFGPFIVIATVLVTFIKADVFIKMYVDFCAFLASGVSDFIFNMLYK